MRICVIDTKNLDIKQAIESIPKYVREDYKAEEYVENEIVFYK